MSRGDGMGPAGMGPMTGRGVGFCAGFPMPGYMNSFPRRGLGFGRGRGYGRMARVGRLFPGRACFGYRLPGRNW